MQLAIAPKGFPKASQEIAVPSLVMELREQVEALKPKPKEQDAAFSELVFTAKQHQTTRKTWPQL